MDWTKSHGHTLSGVRFDDDDEDVRASSSESSRGYTLGGSTPHFVDARTAAAAAALRRLGDAAVVSPPHAESSLSKPPKPEATPGVQSEPDPDEQDSHSVVVIASGAVGKEDALGDDVTVCVPVRSQEPDPDEHVEDMESDPHAALDLVLKSPKRIHNPVSIAASSGLSKMEPDPDADEAGDMVTAGPARSQEPDPDEAVETAVRSQEPDPDEAVETAVRNQEPDPDEASGAPNNSRNEPDATEAADMELNASVRKREPDPDEALGGQSGRNEPDPDEAVDMALDTLAGKQEPDPDEASGGHFCRHEPDPDESVGALVDAHPVRMQEPDPDEVLEADRDRDECVGCSRMAGKRMKSLSGGGFSSLGKSQT